MSAYLMSLCLQRVLSRLELEVDDVTSLLDALVGSIIMSLVVTAALYGIIWVIRNGRRRQVSTPRPFIVPMSVPIGLRNFARRAGRALRFRTAGTERDAPRTANYVVWNERLPVTRKVLEQVRALAKSNEPFFGALVSTHPPTIKIARHIALPIVTQLVAVRDLDPSNLGGVTRDDLVATFHTHRSDLSVLEHDERTFRLVDAFAGPKIHIIGSVKGLQFYRARHGPVFTKRDSKSEVNSALGK